MVREEIAPSLLLVRRCICGGILEMHGGIGPRHWHRRGLRPSHGRGK